MSKFDSTNNISNYDGEQLVLFVQALSNSVKILQNAQRIETISGELNRIPFYTTKEDVSKIQNNLNHTSIELIGLQDKDDNTIDIWVISKSYAYPLKSLIAGATLASINGVIGDKANKDLIISGDLNIGVVSDKAKHSVSINADALRALVDAKLASLRSNLGTIVVSGSNTAKIIDIDPVKSSKLLISSSPNNAIHQASSDKKLFSKKSIITINSELPQPNGDFLVQGDPHITVHGGTNKISLTLE
ncbi:MAG: hypothetical protein KAH32_06155, partial [Chlamydiia bacterium]|nr:hypothetical protein [Chlamydiia bacterium]